MPNLTRDTLTIGGRKLRFAALSLRQLKANKDDIALAMAPGGLNFTHEEAQDVVVRLALVSLQADAPDITEEFLLDGIDTVNFPQIINAIFDRNGFLAKDDDPGEATAALSQS